MSKSTWAIVTWKRSDKSIAVQLQATVAHGEGPQPVQYSVAFGEQEIEISAEDAKILIAAKNGERF